MTEVITRWRKKPVTVEAVQWTGSNEADVQALTGPGNFYPLDEQQRTNCNDPEATAEVYDKLHSTWVLVMTGQWIIRGIKGEFYPCAADMFAETYEPAEAGRAPLDEATRRWHATGVPGERYDANEFRIRHGAGGAVTPATPGHAERILPAYDTVGERELSEAVHQALGAASVCWEPMDCTGVFESRRAAQIGAELTGIIGQYADDFAAPQPQPAPELAAATPGQPGTAWRQGRSQPRNLYARTGGDDWKADLMIGQMDTPELAAEAVRAHNAAIAAQQPTPGLPLRSDAETADMLRADLDRPADALRRSVEARIALWRHEADPDGLGDDDDPLTRDAIRICANELAEDLATWQDQARDFAAQQPQPGCPDPSQHRDVYGRPLPRPAPELAAVSAPSDVRPREDGQRGLDITCGSCGEDYGTNVTDVDEIECPDDEPPAAGVTETKGDQP